MNVGDRLSDHRAMLSDGKETTLARLWAEGPTLLVFLRHFG